VLRRSLRTGNVGAKRCFPGRASALGAAALLPYGVRRHLTHDSGTAWKFRRRSAAFNRLSLLRARPRLLLPCLAEPG
jgi:hypothetical protein